MYPARSRTASVLSRRNRLAGLWICSKFKFDLDCSAHEPMSGWPVALKRIADTAESELPDGASDFPEPQPALARGEKRLRRSLRRTCDRTCPAGGIRLGLGDHGSDGSAGLGRRERGEPGRVHQGASRRLDQGLESNGPGAPTAGLGP